MSSVTKLDCPDCGAGLRIPQVLRPGQLVKCPKCAVTFAAPAAPVVAMLSADPTEALDPTAGSPARATGPAYEPTLEHTPHPTVGDPRVRRRDDWDDDQPARKAGKKKAPPSKRGAMLLLCGAVVVGLLLVTGAIALAWHYLSPMLGSKEREFTMNTAAHLEQPAIRPPTRPPTRGPSNPGEGAEPTMSKQDAAEMVRRELTLPPNAAGNPVVGFGKGNLAPDITGDDLDGRPMKLSDYRGKVVILDFWAHWCQYCRGMYAHEKKLAERLKGRPFAIVGVNFDDTKAIAKKAVLDQQLPGRSWFNGRKGGQIGEQYGVNAFPTLMFIDAKGRLRFKQIGAMPDEAVDQFVDALLDEMDKEKSAGR